MEVILSLLIYAVKILLKKIDNVKKCYIYGFYQINHIDFTTNMVQLS
mgnify:FL=1